MATNRKPAKPAPTPAPASNDTLAPADVESSASDITAPETIELAKMPLQFFEAASSQLQDFRESSRDISLKSVESFRATYDRGKAAAEETVASLEKSFAKTNEAVRTLNVKAIENLQASTFAYFDLAKGIASSLTFTDAFAFASEQMRREVEATAARNREFAELAQSLFEETMAPLGKSVSDAFAIRA